MGFSIVCTIICGISFLFGYGWGYNEGKSKNSTPSDAVWLEAEKYNIDRRWEYIRQKDKNEEAEE